MTQDRPIELLTQRVPAIISSLNADADKYRFGGSRYVRHAILSHMMMAHLSLGIQAYYGDQSIDRLKQNFYVAAMLYLQRFNFAEVQSIDSWHPFLYALLSDNEESINSFACLETADHIQHRDNPCSVNFFPYLYQLAIQGNDSILRQHIELGSKSGTGKNRAEFSAGADFFSLLLERDVPALENSILKLTTSHGVDHPVFEGFMRTPAVIQAKICWRRGLRVSIASPMLPTNLMPVEPIPKYALLYDFLEPNWSYPIQGWMGRFLGRLKER